jgi:hypothetical protein
MHNSISGTEAADRLAIRELIEANTMVFVQKAILISEIRFHEHSICTLQHLRSLQIT